jgi:O-succinylbenzoic acid--CoA ligase
LILRGEDGAIGIGEATPWPRVGTEDADSCLRSLRRLDLLRWPPGLPAGAGPAARHALDLAWLDLRARALRRSVAEQLWPEPAPSVACHRLLLADDPHALAQEGRAALAQGFATLKVKVGGGSPEEDRQRLRALRDAAPGATLRIDTNGGWPDVETALHALRLLADLEIELVEQPTPASDPAALLDVARSSPVPVAADEALTGPSVLPALLARGVLHALVVKPLRLGGLTAGFDLVRRAIHRGMPVLVTTSLDGSIARHGAGELARAVDGIAARFGVRTLAHGLDTGRLLAEDLGDVAEPRAGRWDPDGRTGPADEAPGGPRTARAAPLGPPIPLLRRAGRGLPRFGPLLPFRLVHPRGVLSARALAARADGFAQGVRAGGAEPWVVDAADVPQVAAGLLGAARAGAWLLPIDPRLPREERSRRSRLPLDGAPPGGGVVIFTSGTTGTPRAALLPWSALFASARAVVGHLHYDGDGLWLSALPLAHVGGLMALLRAGIAGATAAVAPAWDLPWVRRIFTQHRPTHASFVARTLQLWLADGAPDPGRLRAVLVGGGPTPPATTEHARALGVPAMPTWGLTEAASTVTVLDLRDGPRSPGDAGWTLPGWTVEIEGPGEGELLLRGPALFRGYLGEPERDSARPWPTGDWGRREPDGRVTVLDRRTDLVVTGGENVYPAEVEARLLRCPLVDEVAIVGLPDERWGQRVSAVVRFRGGPDVPALLSWARDHLSPWQRPRDVHPWAEPLPRTLSGKLRRAHLRDLLRGSTLGSPAREPSDDPL